MIKRIKNPLKTTRKFPSQKKSTSQKNDEWVISCIEGSENLSLFSNHEIRQNYYNKKKNYDLANDIIDMKDVESICSPLGLDISTFPATMQNYPIANPKLKLLLGEGIKRKFDWRVRSTNPDTINSKEDVLKNNLIQFTNDFLSQDKNITEEQLKLNLQELIKRHKSSYQDIREKMASDILSYFFQQQDLKNKFIKGLEDVFIAAEEIYRIDIIAGEPIVTKCNPLNIFTYGTGSSNHIDNADIIIEDSYNPLGKFIDEYYEYLKDEDIKDLENKVYNTQEVNSSTTGSINYKNMFPTMASSTFLEGDINLTTANEINRFGGFFDEAGNIRVTRVVWKSRRKVGKLSYFDEFGDSQSKLVDENYKIDETIGETVEWLWINEYWEGTRIGEDLYVKIQPRPIQFRSLNNLSSCKSGYVGTLYNINSSRARSLFDQMKPYQYLYNIFMYRTEFAFARYKAPMIEINSAAIPDDWDLDKWLYYAEVLGYAIMDPFNESKKGNSTGTLAGNMNTVGGKILSDDSTGNFIQSNIQMLQYIEKQIGNISGVSDQRQGQIEQRELVGNVERSVTQSSHITEHWFHQHDQTKLRVLEVLLETAKYCFKNETDKRLIYILDDLSTNAITVNGELLNEDTYSIFTNNSSKDTEFEQELKQLAHAGLQNDKLTFSDIIKIFSANNITDMANVIEDAEERKNQMEQEKAAKEQENQAAMQKAQAETQERLLQMEIENREDGQAALLDQIRAKGEEDRLTLILQSDLDKSELDNSFIEEAKLQLQERMAERKLKMEEKTKKEEFNLKEKFMEKEFQLKKDKTEKELTIKRQSKAKSN